MRLSIRRHRPSPAQQALRQLVPARGRMKIVQLGEEPLDMRGLAFDLENDVLPTVMRDRRAARGE